ncbi:MAG TPA: DUF948 domain-containing protein [Mycobacteriales bacterium]|jgi:hypothetical protein|nr:DUF948 domain-containing protein [Mycobacteriales bacterium]
MDNAGEIAVLILALFWAVLVVFICVKVLVPIGGVLKAAETSIDRHTDESVPVVAEVKNTVLHVNHELERVDAITENVQVISNNASSLVALFGATLGGPLIKVAAFSYGVRHAAAGRNKAEVEKRVKTAMSDERRAAKVERKQARKRKAS